MKDFANVHFRHTGVCLFFCMFVCELCCNSGLYNIVFADEEIPLVADGGTVASKFTKEVECKTKALGSFGFWCNALTRVTRAVLTLGDGNCSAGGGEHIT